MKKITIPYYVSFVFLPTGVQGQSAKAKICSFLHNDYSRQLGPLQGIAAEWMPALVILLKLNMFTDVCVLRKHKTWYICDGRWLEYRQVQHNQNHPAFCDSST